MSLYERLKENAVDSGEVEGVEYLIVPSPCMKQGLSGLNGYVIFPERPVKEDGYSGIVTYVPVHGGITLAQESDHGFIYGFDTGHYGSELKPRMDPEWIKRQCAIMIKGLRMAAELEDDYLAAGGDNEKKSLICQDLLNLNPDEDLPFGVMLNLLCGNL